MEGIECVVIRSFIIFHASCLEYVHPSPHTNSRTSSPATVLVRKLFLRVGSEP